jgi:hypothetical protein
MCKTSPEFSINAPMASDKAGRLESFQMISR